MQQTNLKTAERGILPSDIVVNIRKHHQYGKVSNRLYTYCGRPGPWGNPYRLSRNHDARELTQVLLKHQEYLNQKIREGRITPQDLANLVRTPDTREARTLGCWCAPSPCHATTLAIYGLAAGKSEAALDKAMRTPVITPLSR